VITLWLSTTWTQVWLVVVSTLVIFASVITYTRIAGLRSFSKMSSFDFASTVAIGSIIATVAVTQASLLNGMIGLGTLYLAQSMIAWLRRRTFVEKLVDNRPVLLMAGPQILHENLHRTSVTRADLRAKLREANVTQPEQILAVVLETTGDVSVLHGDGPLDVALLAAVIGREHLLEHLTE
jgi:uncharacterized membrane protein YcaP (DUF421 family)